MNKYYTPINGKVYEVANTDQPKGAFTLEADAQAVANDQAKALADKQTKEQKAIWAQLEAQAAARLKAMSKEERELVSIQAKDPKGYARAKASAHLIRYKALKA